MAVKLRTLEFVDYRGILVNRLQFFPPSEGRELTMTAIIGNPAPDFSVRKVFKVTYASWKRERPLKS